MIDRTALFDLLRSIVKEHGGGGLTQSDVDRVNALLDAPEKPADGEVDPQLVADLKRDEGLRLSAYKDTVGVWTIGYGHAHVAPGTVWTREQAEAALIEDIKKHNAELREALPWIDGLSPNRRRVLQNMVFNLGLGSAATGKGLLGFKNTLAKIQAGDYSGAASNMLQSKWAKQVGERASRLAAHMRNG